MSAFVDTNVLVYARDTGAGHKHAGARAWMDRLWQTGQGRLSTQVLNEYYVTVTRKLDPGMTIDAARADVRDLLTWHPVPVDAELVTQAWAVEDRFGLSHWDSLIVAAAHALGCRQLLSEDLQENQDLDGLVVINPFTREPDDILGT